MPALAPKTATSAQGQSQETAVNPPAIAEQDPAKEQLKEGGAAAGLANYQASLSKWLGTELYGALSKELTLEALQGHATKAWKSALESGVKAIDGVDGNDSEAGKFTAALQEAYGEAAAELLTTETGEKIIGKLNGFVDANPRLILLVALLAAGGAIAANVSLPEFKQKFDLGAGFSGSVGADLGKIRDIALKDLSASLEYNSGPLIAAAAVNRDEDGEVTGTISAQLGDETKNIKGNAKFTADGVEIYGLSAMLKKDNGTSLSAGVTGGSNASTVVSGAITTQHGDTTQSTSANYDVGTGAVTIKNTTTTTLDSGTKLKSEVGTSTEGSTYGGVSASGNLNENTTASAGFKQTQSADGAIDNSINGSVAYKKDDLSADITGNYSDVTGGSITGNIATKIGENTSAGGSLTHNFGDESGTKGSGYVDYKTLDLRLRTGFNFDTANNGYGVNGLAQKSFGDDWKGRVQGSYNTSDKGTNAEFGGLAYHKFNKDLSVFGGGAVRYDDVQGTRFVPKVGVEVKGVPIEYSYDPKTKQHKVGVTLFSW